MPRQPRVCVAGLPHHIVQRGNNRQDIFRSPRDYVTYLRYLEDASKKNGCEIHAYVLMTNHVHLLVTPKKDESLSRSMHKLSCRYARYFNSINERTGTLWEGRFKSSVVDTLQYCLCCFRYIELNPLRAGLVDDPAKYRWSSYNSNAFGSPNDLLTPHAEYLRLGETRSERQSEYKKLVESGITEHELKRIRSGAQNGTPTGNPEFREDILKRFEINQPVRVFDTNLTDPT